MDCSKYGCPTAYTRNGAFELADDGQWMAVGGSRLMCGFMSILPGDETLISIPGSGVVFGSGNSGRFYFNTVLIRFPNPAGLKKIGPNLFVATETSGTPEVGVPGENGYGFLIQGFLESLPE